MTVQRRMVVTMAEDSTGGDVAASSMATTLKGAFLGSLPRILGTMLLSIVVVSGGAVAAGVVGVPAVQNFDNEFTNVTDSTTAIGTNIEVQNPNPIGASFLDVSGEYTVTMNDVRMANGSTGEIEMPPGNSSIALQTTMDNDRIPEWWTTHVNNDEQTTVRVNATVESDFLGRSVPVKQNRTIETDILSSFNSTETREVNADRALVEDPVMYVNETRAHWGETSGARTGIVVDFYIYNPKEYAIPLSELRYTIDMNDVRVGKGENSDPAVLEPNELTRVRTVTYIDNSKLDDWWVSHLERNQVTDVVIDFEASAEVSGTDIDIPLDGMTHRETFETDVLGSKGDTAPDGANDSDGGTNGSDGTGTNDSEDAGTTTEPGTTTTSDDGSGGDDGTTTTDDGVLSVGDRTRWPTPVA